ncbi:hypothetical protein [Kitasatospora sp. NPDC056184]|uniref:hypothetical protein n=1 Tax=Kitasatospora sp. NPDC056184 TaxID=3345738 RepID=UPI0035DC08EF
MRVGPGAAVELPLLVWARLYEAEGLKEIRTGRGAELSRLLLAGWSRVPRGVGVGAG